jgi:uncharacterized membrane protein
MRLNRFFFVLTLFNAAFLAWSWSKLPAIVPTHVGISGNIDGWGSKQLLLVIAIVPLGLAIANLFRIQKVASHILAGLTLFFLPISWMPVYLANQYDQSAAFSNDILQLLIMLPLGLLFLFLGRMMPNLKMNNWVGIRTPWTFASETVWNETHRYSGKLYTVGGTIVSLGSLVGFGIQNWFVAIAGLLAALPFIIVIPVVYSYRLYKKEEEGLRLN